MRWSYPQRERGAHQSHPVGQMSERIECELRCPACGVWFCDPVRLQCAHSVCVRCAERLLCASASAAATGATSAVLSCAASLTGCGAGDAAALTLAIPPPPAPLALAAADRCSAPRAPPPRKRSQPQPQAPSTQSRSGALQNTSTGSGTPESASASTSDIVSESDSGVALGPFHASPNSCAGGPKSPGEHNGSTALGSPAHSIGALAGLPIDHKLLQQSAAQSNPSLRIECPLCGVATCVSSVAQLPRNKLLANIVRRCCPTQAAASALRAQSLVARPLSSASDSSGSVAGGSARVPLPPPSPSPSASSSSSLCHFCASNEASRRCVQCATALCEECAARSHPPTASGLAAHSIVPLERPRTPRSPPSTSTSNCTTPTLPATATAQSNPTSAEGPGPSPWALAATPAPAPAESACALHPENARRFYCSVCAQVLCETCAEQATHTAHQILPLIAAAKLHKVLTTAHTHAP